MTTSSARSAAIIGAGQTGVTAALGLLDNGFDVTLYSEREQAQLRDGIPASGTALIFGAAQRAEESLGLNTYLATAPLSTGQSVRVLNDGAEDVAFDGWFDGARGVAVDTRLKADDRLTLFQQRGGRFVVQPVDPERLDAIAAKADLTLVATGRGGLSSLFPVDPARTVYDAPQRSLLAFTVTGLPHGPEIFAHRSTAGGAHNAFTVVTDQGESWWGPYLHKDAGPTWAFLGWARPGSDWERRFATVTSARSALQVTTGLHRDYIDWDLPEVSALRVIDEDPHSWLTGAVTQLVRTAVGHTASGHPVAALGDTAVAFDPIAGQGAQGGLVQSAALVRKAAAHDGPFDAAWLSAAFDEFYDHRARAAQLVTRLFLADPELSGYGGLFFAAASGSARFASKLFGLLDDPRPFESVTSEAAAKQLITDFTGEPADELLARFVPAGTFQRSGLAFSAV
ncbi:styrene monooxygenase/indole monooxygenase family protein [Mycolicibacterium fluoranthenivorans]|uniref:2-polyprenyl-6-methoxyphenol hydroxylase-like FAD-dependent oxidoreductase n=1 Tax=Mycolicibacterium fluoranthenivorans TaxID=258505 RepID=A0A7X5U2T5_9MYCO|nr:styrene monooxygenase/indole monooxygenase family protein [Mycolicibacterium fluoranthenivorans]MCV7354068.1 cadherin repeat domain-containing protein [Mycolicibacterium fluoranthenivorans]NIH97372.1 2-polyprenyl-6-methoxyphenol hydroxylase-like FAD-dependent oxidoreductase [Mycolicibacterium fluoranthenivorans]